MATSARRGRRPGSPDTRAEILAQARTLFASHGYAGTSVRSVAAAAGVDAALVHHYFGTKDDLFLAALQVPIDPREVLVPVAEGGLDGAGERLLRVFLSVWDDEATRLPLLALVRGVFEPEGRLLVRDGFMRMVLGPVGAALEVDQPELRMSLVASPADRAGAGPLRRRRRAARLASSRAGRGVRPDPPAVPPGAVGLTPLTSGCSRRARVP